MKVLKYILSVICRILAIVYAVTVMPIFFILMSVLVTAVFLLAGVEWIIRGDAEICNDVIYWITVDAWNAVKKGLWKLSNL